MSTALVFLAGVLTGPAVIVGAGIIMMRIAFRHPCGRLSRFQQRIATQNIEIALSLANACGRQLEARK